jgi:hypothetical protein
MSDFTHCQRTLLLVNVMIINADPALAKCGHTKVLYFYSVWIRVIGLRQGGVSSTEKVWRNMQNQFGVSTLRQVSYYLIVLLFEQMKHEPPQFFLRGTCMKWMRFSPPRRHLIRRPLTRVFKHFFFSLLKPVTSMESVRNDLQEALPLLD